ncbi:MAG TPA: EF-hand domain-containing protein, partial [Gemmataceae bacterium]|nr:EF-hand domain-containing protein [Gemmataceae bacterium]
MKRSLRFAAVCAALLVVPLAVNSQPPGGDGGRGGRGGFGGGRGPGGGGFGDPSQFFDRLANGKDVIVIDQLDDRMKMMAQRMAQTAGITNGQITRDQFNTAMESFRAMRGGRGGPPGGGDGKSAPAAAPATSGEDTDRHAEDSFRKHDKNNDGQLDFNEMPDSLKSGLANYDTNKDGLINLDEFKSYYRDRIQLRMQEQGQAGGQASADGLPPAAESGPLPEEEEKRQTVYRFGKLPKEVPAWFAEMDVDKDGQVGLWEWVRVRGSQSI